MSDNLARIVAEAIASNRGDKPEHWSGVGRIVAAALRADLPATLRALGLVQQSDRDTDAYGSWIPANPDQAE